MSCVNYPVVVSVASPNAIKTETFNITKIRWVGGSTAGHQALVYDNLGNPKFATVATGANYVESESFEVQPLACVGLVVPTLDSGTLYIYIQDL